MKQYHFIYRTTNLINFKEYIGVHSTDDLTDGYLGSGTAILNAIKKYGRSNFSREILEWFDWRCEALNREAQIVTTEYISKPNVYNAFVGGESGAYGFKHSDDSKKKMSDTHVGLMKGYQHSDDARMNMSIAAKHRYVYNPTSHPMLGKRREFTDEWKQNISNSLKGRVGSWLGRIHSESSKQKIKDARSRQVLSDEHILKFKTSRVGCVVTQSTKDKISQIQSMACSIDGVIYSSIISASRSVGISDTTVGRRLKSDKYPTWFYLNDTNNIIKEN